MYGHHSTGSVDVSDGSSSCIHKVFIFTIRGVGEGVVNDGVKGTGPSGGGHSRESWHQTGKDKELLLSAVFPQGLQPQQEETDPLAADLDRRRLGKYQDITVEYEGISLIFSYNHNYPL